MKKIIVTGATGTIGQVLLPLLLEEEVEVVAITRSPDKIQSEHPKLSVVEADLKNQTSYLDALEGANAAFLLTDGTRKMDSIQNDFIEACQTKNVPFIVKQSAMGAAPDAQVEIFRMHYAAEEKLRTSGLFYCILQPNSFTQNLLAHAQSIKEQGAIYAPMGEGKVSYVDTRDVAQVAATVLVEGSKLHKNKTYALTGPTAVSMTENANAIGDILGKEVHYYPVSYGQGKEAMLGFGMEEWLVDDMIAIARLGAEGEASRVTETVREITGSEARSVADSMIEYQSYFK